MIRYYSAALKSMLQSSSRLDGRPWLAEYICRSLKIILQAPENKSLPRLRKVIDSAATFHPAARKVDFKAIEWSGVPCLEVTPKIQPASSQDQPTVIVYLHGGGYVFGSPNGYKPLIAQLAINNQATVVAVDYRLAPEHPYPAPQNDCLSAIRAIFNKHSDSKKIIAGDSAGGALAIMAVLALKIESTPADACVLISPWVDPLATAGSIVGNRENDFLTLSFLQESFEHLMQGQAPTERVRFNDADLDSLPPTLIQCGSGEIFFDQIQHFAERAEKAGVKLTLQNTAKQFHVFQLLSPVFKDSREAVQAIADFIDTIEIDAIPFDVTQVEVV